MNAKRKQVVDQCRAVAHMANSLAQVHDDFARIYGGESSVPDIVGVLDIVGRRTASFMEQLGDMLNAVDAVEEEDDWMEPIFNEAHRLWPQPVSSEAS